MISTLSILLAGLDPDRCVLAIETAPHYTECAAAGSGVALSLDRAEASDLINWVETAKPQFVQHFPSSPGPYVVLYFVDEPPVDALKSAGFPTILAWASPESMGSLFIESMRQPTAESSGGVVSVDAQRAIETQALAMISSLKAQQGDVIAHEMGHLWYRETYWADSKAELDGYGTPAPDWLDETAAILAEGAAAAERRRAVFKRTWTASEPGARLEDRGIGDLDYFLRRSHPSQSETQEASASSTSNVSVTVTVRGSGANKNAFYSQARVFADFMIDRTSDPTIFSKVTHFLANGGTMQGWLAEQKDYPSLPRSVARLQEDWIVWINEGSGSREAGY